MNTQHTDPNLETHRQIKAYTFEMDDQCKWVTLITVDGRYSRRVSDLLKVLTNPDLEPGPRKMYHEMLEFAQTNSAMEKQ